MASGPARSILSRELRCGTLALLLVAALAWLGSGVGAYVRFDCEPGDLYFYELDRGFLIRWDFRSSKWSFVDSTEARRREERRHWWFMWKPIWRDENLSDALVDAPRQMLPQFKRGSNRQGWEIVAIPLWIPFLALAVLAVVQLAPEWRRRRRAWGGCCKRCGYDLRATPEQCPECGLPARVRSGTTSPEP